MNRNGTLLHNLSRLSSSSQMNKKLPKLSYVLLSHNREKYIRNAIMSAFAQDYEGELEYIFSDDCSTDKTFEIIQECVAEYKGDRKVIVTQTPHNMHLAGHTNHAVALATGDWIIRADDDDLSSIDRCSIVAQAIAEHPDCTYVLTDFQRFSPADIVPTLQLSANKNTYPTGKTTIIKASKETDIMPWFSKFHLTWNKAVYDQFSPLPSDAYYIDDLTCYFRANIIGYGVYVPIITAYTCQGSFNMSSGLNDGKRGYKEIIRLERFNDNYYNITYPAALSTLNELKEYAGTMPPENRDQYDSVFDSMSRFIAKTGIYRTFWRKGIINRIRITQQIGKWSLFSIIRCLPMPVFAAIQASVRRVAALFK